MIYFKNFFLLNYFLPFLFFPPVFSNHFGQIFFFLHSILSLCLEVIYFIAILLVIILEISTYHLHNEILKLITIILFTQMQAKTPPPLFFFLKNFIYFWLRCVFIAVHRLSLVVENRGYSLLWCTGFSLQWLLLLGSTGSRCTGLQ